MKKIMLGLLVIGTLLIANGMRNKVEVKENYVLDNTVFLHVESTGDNKRDIENTLKYIEENKMNSNDLVIRIYKKDKIKCQAEFENKKQINFVEVNSNEY